MTGGKKSLARAAGRAGFLLTGLGLLCPPFLPRAMPKPDPGFLHEKGVGKHFPYLSIVTYG
jgi:hypothetical protein